MKNLEEKIVYDSDHSDLFKVEFKTVDKKHPSWRVFESSSNCYSVCRVLWDIFKDEEGVEKVAVFETLDEAIDYIKCQISENG